MAGLIDKYSWPTGGSEEALLLQDKPLLATADCY
jgi:hypothetical protein